MTRIDQRTSPPPQPVRVSDDAGNEAHDGLDHGQCGHLTTVENVVPEADLTDVEQFGGPLEHPVVDALVAAAGEGHSRQFGQLLG